MHPHTTRTDSLVRSQNPKPGIHLPCHGWNRAYWAWVLMKILSHTDPNVKIIIVHEPCSLFAFLGSFWSIKAPDLERLVWENPGHIKLDIFQKFSLWDCQVTSNLTGVGGREIWIRKTHPLPCPQPPQNKKTVVLLKKMCYNFRIFKVVSVTSV